MPHRAGFAGCWLPVAPARSSWSRGCSSGVCLSWRQAGCWRAVLPCRLRGPPRFPRGGCFLGLWLHYPGSASVSHRLLPSACPIAPVFLLQPTQRTRFISSPCAWLLCKGPCPSRSQSQGRVFREPTLARCRGHAGRAASQDSLRAPFAERSAGTTLKCVMNKGPLPFVLLWAPLTPLPVLVP